MRALLARLPNNASKRTSRRFSLPARRLAQCSPAPSGKELLRRSLRVSLVVLFLGCLPRVAVACTCGCPPSGPCPPMIEDTLLTADVGIVGLVVGRGTRDGRPSESNGDAAYVDVEVLDSVQGMRLGTTLRVWDENFDNNCGGGFPLRNAQIVAMALRRTTLGRDELWRLSRLTVGLNDYLIGACAQYFRPLATIREGTALTSMVRARQKRLR